MRKSSLCYYRALRAFSVVELLVILVIISALALLIIPAGQKAREISQNVKCVSNLRQMATGTFTYFHEHNGRLLPSVFWYRSSTTPPNSGGIIQEGISEYLGLPVSSGGVDSYRDTVLSCPAFARKFPTLFPSNWNRAYSVNMRAHAFDPILQQAGLPTDNTFFPGNLQRIRSLSSMWLYMDGAGSIDGRYVFTYLSNSHLPYVASPHAKKQNAVFFDGHVEQISANKLALPQSNDFWGGPIE